AGAPLPRPRERDPHGQPKRNPVYPQALARSLPWRCMAAVSGRPMAEVSPELSLRSISAVLSRSPANAVAAVYASPPASFPSDRTLPAVSVNFWAVADAPLGDVIDMPPVEKFRSSVSMFLQAVFFFPPAMASTAPQPVEPSIKPPAMTTPTS